MAFYIIIAIISTLFIVFFLMKIHRLNIGSSYKLITNTETAVVNQHLGVSMKAVDLIKEGEFVLVEVNYKTGRVERKKKDIIEEALVDKQNQLVVFDKAYFNSLEKDMESYKKVRDKILQIRGVEDVSTEGLVSEMDKILSTYEKTDNKLAILHHLATLSHIAVSTILALHLGSSITRDED